tara:strand:- start:600 stop:1043 length:444 start_codon:yes stop_codon:yes gene_type:complete
MIGRALLAWILAVILAAIFIGPANAATGTAPAIDLRLVLTIGGMVASVVAASAVAKFQIKSLSEKLEDIEQRLRKMDSRSDRLVTATETQEQRISILSKMASPENLRRDHMQISQMLTHLEHLQKSYDKLYAMHNGEHPPVASERKT